MRATEVLLEASGVDIEAPSGRPLVRGLRIRLGRDRVAMIGRNGVGKSSLLEVLAGEARPSRGTVVLRTQPVVVPQRLDGIDSDGVRRSLLLRAGGSGLGAAALASELAGAGLQAEGTLAPHRDLSLGERRKLCLLSAKLRAPDLLLLDEPTQDLDDQGLGWLRRWLATWPGALLVVSHDRSLLEEFRHFFLVAESGCRQFVGTVAELEAELDQEAEANQIRYVRRLNVLVQREEHSERFRRRRERKKNVGRVRELGRMTPRLRLNQKRSYAQEKQGRIAKVREDRIGRVRAWARAARRALAVTLPLDAAMPRLPEDDGADLVKLEGVGVAIGDRWLFSGVSLRLRRDRLAIAGPNGVGKTTALRVMLGHLAPTQGLARRCAERIGSIEQGGTDWLSDECLLERIVRVSAGASVASVAAVLVAHRFPLALAERPLLSLSPGERVRAALICLSQQTPPVELLALDEPTDGLDFAAASALRRVLRAWPGGLVVISHDRHFLESIGVDRWLTLDGTGGHRLEAGALGIGR